jgi:hypothetical protein
MFENILIDTASRPKNYFMNFVVSTSIPAVTKYGFCGPASIEHIYTSL